MQQSRRPNEPAPSERPREVVLTAGSGDASRSLAEVAAVVLQRPYARRGVPMSDETIRVLLVDDHTLFRAGLRALLRGSAPDVAVVGEATSGHEAVAAAARLSPHVIVMDLDMPDGDGIEATRDVLELHPAPRVLVLTMHSEEARLLEALEAGASGFLMKDAADRELVDAVRAVAVGEIYVRPQVARFLAASIRGQAATPHAEDRLGKLSGRERTVVELMAEGFNGPEIGDRLGISAKTVETYKQRIGEKLGIEHRSEYVRLALEEGLLHR